MSKKHRGEHHEEHVDESWLIPYADLLTLLLALFIVLFATSTTDAKKLEDMAQAFNIAFNGGTGLLDQTSVIKTGPDQEKEQKDDEKSKQETKKKELERASMIKKEQEELEKLKKQLDKYIQSNGLTNQLETKLNQSQLMITISDKALFPSGSATIKPEARTLAVAIADMLVQYPGYEIIVSGHTDNEPISTSDFKSNWDLSSTRAIRFMDILLSNKKLDPRLFSAIGYGEYRPVASNNTDAGKAKNRRVEVSIIRKYVDSENASQIPATPK